jgi:hypothetical protein
MSHEQIVSRDSKDNKVRLASSSEALGHREFEIRNGATY